MGEAKKKREVMAQQLRLQAERWSFPESEAETQAVAEISKLDTVTVRRVSPDKLAYMRMEPNQCHANALFMENNDPQRKTKRISGYWLQQGNYVLHSVIKDDNGYFCVTPIVIGAPPVFDFIPDPDIEWREENDFRVAYRKGIPVEPGFRGDPAETKRMSSVIVARLDAGMSPMEATRMPL